MEEVILNHPLIEHKISILRNVKTGTKEFREIVKEISFILCYEFMRDAKTYNYKVETPIMKANCKKIKEDDFVFVPILRAGLGMSEGIISIIPNAKFGHIGLSRNEETLEPNRYYYKVPNNIENKHIVLLDPMLATGGSASAAIKMLKDDGIKQITFLCILGTETGFNKIKNDHPDVKIYCAKLDDGLNEKGYIYPGLGDAGDRIYGTK